MYKTPLNLLSQFFYVQNTFKSPISVFLSFPLNTFQWSIFIIEYMLRNWVYRVYAKELIIYYLFIYYLTLRARNKRLRKKPVAAENRIAPWSHPVLAAKSPRVKHGKGPCVPPWLGMKKSFIKIPSQKSINSSSNQNHPVLAAKSPRVNMARVPEYHPG